MIVSRRRLLKWQRSITGLVESGANIVLSRLLGFYHISVGKKSFQILIFKNHFADNRYVE